MTAIHPGAAMANNECGALAPAAAVTCPSGNIPGIVYTGLSGGGPLNPSQVNIPAGTTVTTGGVSLSGAGAITLDAAPGTTISNTTTGAQPRAVLIQSSTGDATARIDDAAAIGTPGIATVRLSATAPDARATLNAGDVTSANGLGVSATGGGGVLIVADSVTTTGHSTATLSNGTGIQVDTVAGRQPPAPIEIQVGSVSTSGRGATGIQTSVGAADIRVGSVATANLGASGVVALTNVSGGKIDVDVGTVNISAGGLLFSNPAAGGNGLYFPSIGIVASSNTGDVNIAVDEVATTGALSGGVTVQNTTGEATINVGTITTTGDGAYGISTASLKGDLTVNAGTVSTLGGVLEQAAVNAAQNGRTTFFADAIEATSREGHVTVNSGSATAAGEGAQAITIVAAQGASLSSGTARAGGEGVNAIAIISDHGAINAVLNGATTAANGNAVRVIALNDTTVDLAIAATGSAVGRDVGVEVDVGSGAAVVTNRGRIETTGAVLTGASQGALTLSAANGGAGVVVNNHGAVVGGLAATGVQGSAINFISNNNDTLNLFTGSNITGSIKGLGGRDTLNLSGTVATQTAAQSFGDVFEFEDLNALRGFWTFNGDGAFDTINVAGGTLLLAGEVAGDAVVGSGGTLQIGTGGLAGSLNGSLVADGTVIFNRSDDYLFAGAFSGDGLLIKRGAGRLTLDGAYTFTGDTLLQGGTIKITQLSATGTLNLGAGASLDLSSATPGQQQSIGRLSGDAGSTVNIANSNLIVENPTPEVPSVFNGSLTGAGSLTLDGAGTLVLGGANTYTGPTTVNGGQLIVNGSVSSAVTINEGGALGGAGTLNGSLQLRRGAVLAPGNSPGVLTVGSLDLASGSKMIVEVDPTLAVTHDRVNVTGAATIASGALLEVQPLGALGNYDRVNHFTIISAAGGLSGAFDRNDITSTMPLLTPHVLYTAQEANLRLVRNDIAFSTLASTPNQIAIANAAEATGAYAAPYEAVVAQDAAGARLGFDQMSGEAHGAIGSFLINESARQRMVLSRQAQADPGAWAELSANDASIGADGNAAGAESRGRHLSGGASREAGEWTLGAFLTLAESDVLAGARNSRAEIRTARLGFYAAREAGGWRIAGGGEVASQDIEATRLPTFTGLSQQLTSDYRASVRQGFLNISHDARVGGVLLQPFVDIAGVSLSTGRFSETGGSLALDVHGQDREVVFTAVGARLSADASAGEAIFRPRVSLAWRRASGDLAGATTAEFGSGPFKVAGAGIAKNSALVELGLDIKLGESMTAWLSYDAIMSSGSRDESARAGARLRF